MIYMVNARKSYCDYGIVFASQSKESCEKYIADCGSLEYEYNIIEVELDTPYTIHHMWGLEEGDAL